LFEQTVEKNAIQKKVASRQGGNASLPKFYAVGKLSSSPKIRLSEIAHKVVFKVVGLVIDI